jgi:hypothetical protein
MCRNASTGVQQASVSNGASFEPVGSKVSESVLWLQWERQIYALFDKPDEKVKQDKKTVWI